MNKYVNFKKLHEFEKGKIVGKTKFRDGLRKYELYRKETEFFFVR